MKNRGPSGHIRIQHCAKEDLGTLCGTCPVKTGAGFMYVIVPLTGGNVSKSKLKDTKNK